MDLSRVEELTTLLRRSLDSVTVRDARNQSIDVREYRSNLRNLRDVYDPDMRTRMSLVSPDIGELGIRQATLNFIRTELADYLWDDKINYSPNDFVHGNDRSACSPDVILRNLLRKAIVDGEPAAAHAFAENLAGSSCMYRQYFGVSGLQVDREVEVFEGVRLVPVSNSSDQLPPYLPDASLSKQLFIRMPGEIMTGVPWVRTLLEVDYEVSPAFYKPLPLR